MIAYITPDNTGITRRFALIADDRDDARAEALLLGRALFRGPFRYCVRAA